MSDFEPIPSDNAVDYSIYPLCLCGHEADAHVDPDGELVDCKYEDGCPCADYQAPGREP